MDAREQSRTRKEGRRVHNQQDGAGIIAACRQIVETGSFAKINGVMVDLFTASAIVKVHDAINEQNRAKLLALPLPRIAAICFKMLG